MSTVRAIYGVTPGYVIYLERLLILTFESRMMLAMPSTERRIVVITGLGGMGMAIAKRLGSGATLVLGDVDAEVVAAAGEDLRRDGYEVIEQLTDVSQAASVAALAGAAAGAGRVEVVAHTAGVSPVHASVEAILQVDLLGCALMLDAFASVMAAGGAGVFIASMAGTLATQDPDFERRLATTPTAELLALPELSGGLIADPGAAYVVAKRANQLRVRAASLVWGRRGARVNSISPGIISTAMGVAELQGASGEFMRAVVDGSPTGRVGTPQDIAGAVEFLAGPQSSYITGTDVLVDGGAVASLISPGLEAVADIQ